MISVDDIFYFRKMEKLLSVGDKLEDKRDQGKSLMHSCTLRFRNPEMEAAVSLASAKC